jgi:heptose-I-phosphate ethanolaminephosphotransferase
MRFVAAHDRKVLEMLAEKNPNIKKTVDTTKRIDWAGLGWLYLFFWYFSGVIQTLLLPTTSIQGFRSAFFMSFIWLAPVLLFPRWTRFIAAILGLIFWAVSLISLGYWAIYGREFSPGVIFTIFETNATETKEFLSQYFTLRLAFIITIYTFIACLLWKKLRPVYLSRFHAGAIALFVILSILGSPYIKYFTGSISFAGATRKLQLKMEPATPWQLVMGYLQYRKQLNSIQAFLHDNDSLAPFENLVDVNGDVPRTLVLIIGESTTSRRMSLYGYLRKTTPHLDALKEQAQLVVFNDVIASRPYTTGMFQQALSFANQEEPNRYLTEPNLMNLMKQAGYKVFWITNHITISNSNTLTLTFSQQADETRYMNNQRVHNSSTQYDQVVFEPFAKILNDSAPKKFIVIHLLGAHTKYSARSPDDYKKFITRDATPEPLSNSQVKTYNDYDNAILYNDFVVSSLIDIFSKSDPNGFLIYFSDHGEEVFHEPPYQTLGRYEDAPTVDMYAIPFILWMSSIWKKTHSNDFNSMIDRKYSTEHFIHTWSDLAGLHYDRFQPELSIVSPDFKERIRKIGDPHTENNLRDFDATVVSKSAVLSTKQ